MTDIPRGARRTGPAAGPAATTYLLVAAIGLLVCAGGGAGAQAPDRAQADALARRAAARMQALQQEADGLASRERTLLEELRKLEVEREMKSALLADAHSALARIQQEMAETTARIDALEHTQVSQLPDLTARLVDIYKLGNGGYVRLLLSVDNLREMGRAYRFVSALQSLDHRRVAEHRHTLAALRESQATLAARHAAAEHAAQEATSARSAADKAAAAYENLVRRIDARRDMTAQLMGELDAARQKLQRTINDTSHGSGTDAPLALPLRPFRGDLDWPLQGRVLSTFGRQVDRRFYTAVVSNGLRIQAAPSTPVAAIHEGTVAFAEPFPGFGNLVIVDHGGLAFSLYGYLSAIDVRPGTRLARGQAIGASGTALDGTAALYFELRIDGKPVDPLQWLKVR